MRNLLLIDNDGQSIRSSNYWDAPVGQYYVSANAGAFRVLLTREAESHLPDMRGAKVAAISRGPWPAAGFRDAYEILFDDGSDAPFALHTAPEAFDRTLPDSEAGRRCVLTVWVGRGGRPVKVLELPCIYRRAAKLPDLRPWEET